MVRGRFGEGVVWSAGLRRRLRLERGDFSEERQPLLGKGCSEGG